jgi:glycosyltransferase involved in cell wall biosynthesis
LGAIPDLARLFEQVRLTAAPLRYGAGIKGKVLDSFAAGLPCVMTPIAAEGLRLPAMLGQSIGTDTEALAALIVRAHQDENFATQLGEAGLALIARDFTDRTVTKALHAAIQGLKPPDKTLAK